MSECIAVTDKNDDDNSDRCSSNPDRHDNDDDNDGEDDDIIDRYDESDDESSC